MGNSISNSPKHISLIKSNGEPIELLPLNEYQSLGAGVMIIVHTEKGSFIIRFQSFNGDIRLSCGGSVEKSETDIRKAIVREYCEETYIDLYNHIQEFPLVEQYLSEHGLDINEIKNHYLLPKIKPSCLDNSTFLLYKGSDYNYITTSVQIQMVYNDLLNAIKTMNHLSEACRPQRNAFIAELHNDEFCPAEVSYKKDKNGKETVEMVGKEHKRFFEALRQQANNPYHIVELLDKIEKISMFTEFTEFSLVNFSKQCQEILVGKSDLEKYVLKSVEPLFQHAPELNPDNKGWSLLL